MIVSDGGAFACAGKVLFERSLEALEAPLREAEGHGLCVYQPSKHFFLCGPSCIACPKLFNGNGLLSGVGIVRGQWPKDIVDGVHQHPMDVSAGIGIALGGSKKVVDINVNVANTPPSRVVEMRVRLLW